MDETFHLTPLDVRRYDFGHKLRGYDPERVEQFRTALQRTRERLDAYTLELQNHGLESVEREVKWLDALIETERRAGDETLSKRGSTSRRRTGPPPVRPQEWKESR